MISSVFINEKVSRITPEHAVLVPFVWTNVKSIKSPKS